MTRYVFRLTIAILGFAIGCGISTLSLWLRRPVTSGAQTNSRANVKPLIDTADQIRASPYSSIKLTVARLSAFHVEDDYDRIPPGVGPLLHELKRQLRDLAADTLNEHGKQIPNAEEVEERLNSILREEGLLTVEDADQDDNESSDTSFFYGGIYAFSVRRAPNNPG